MKESIEITEFTRPIKIAYIVPSSTSKKNHWILDAVFHDAYTRWGGARTLVIPSTRSGFLDEQYEAWLEFFDPDFIYSYVSISSKLVEKIDKLCSPIVLKKHNPNSRAEPSRWQDYLPNFGTYFEAVSSLTTIHSPSSGRLSPLTDTGVELPTLLTQYGISNERFFSDNFGVCHHHSAYTNPIKGLFETCCFTSEVVANNPTMNMGTIKLSSTNDILMMLAEQKLLTFSKLSMMHDSGVPIVESHEWRDAFHLFIGNTCLDRIHFWNSRHLVSKWSGVPNALIVRKAQLRDDEFISALGQYFNHNNYTSSSGGQHNVTLRSVSHTKEELENYVALLQPKTYNFVFVDGVQYSKPALPNGRDLEHVYSGSRKSRKFKINETENEIEAQEPEHFLYSPPRFIGLNTGNWAVDISIERHNNLSKYSNVVDTWLLPRRSSAASCFTEKLSKVNKNHFLTLIPNSDRHPFRSTEAKQRLKYNLRLPSDESFFRCLIVRPPRFYQDDLRFAELYDGYKDIAISDKGQNLRGVISMFPNLSESYEILTNRLWRCVIADSPKGEIKTLEKIHGYIDNSRDYKDKLADELRIGKRLVPKYLKENFTDTLEYLVELDIFHQLYSWRCEYCGYTNSRSVNDAKKKDNCTICDREHFLPIDAEWKYRLNNFVYSALHERSGLTVLWGLGSLQDRCFEHSFYYLPEVDLYLDRNNSERKEEIDILCVNAGQFIAGEAKRSVFGFTRENGIQSDKHIDKFVQKINLLKPDIALLVFQRLSGNQDEEDQSQVQAELDGAVQEIREKSNIAGLEIEVLVASQCTDFSNFPVNLGVWGERTRKVLG